MENKTATIKDIMAAIKVIAEDNALEIPVSDEVVVTSEDIISYAEKTVAAIDRKNEKAKERNAAKKAEGDALREEVLAALTSEPQTRTEIFANFSGREDITISKVGARLTQLVNAGQAVKTEVKPEGSKSKVMAYSLA